MATSSDVPAGWDLRHDSRSKAKASDLESSEYAECGMRLSIRMRNSTLVGVQPPRRGPFALGKFVDAVETYHRSIDRGSAHTEALSTARRRYETLHRGWCTFLDRALDAYAELHEAREAALGKSLQYVNVHIESSMSDKVSAYAWALLYQSADGHREVRRIRMSSPRSAVTEWAAIAARAAADHDGTPASTVSVIEFAVATGLETVIVDTISAHEARAMFDRARERARTVYRATQRTACSNCTDCKALAVCDAPIPMAGVLRQPGVGPWPRTLSQQDLIAYRRCPAQWYLHRDSKLPSVDSATDTTMRDTGTTAHTWLTVAHSRVATCSAGDLPDVSDRASGDVAYDLLDDDQYAAALPILRQHLAHCRAGDGDVLAVDENLFGYDSTADVVIVAKPDLVTRRSRTLVVREVKTTSKPLPENASTARDQFDEVVYWLLSLGDGGWRQYFGCDDVQVELEVLRGDDSQLFTYNSTDPALMELAGYRMEDRVTDWHNDTAWTARPGPICTYCPVAHWCPDADAPPNAAGAPAGSSTADDDEPPF